MIKRFKKSKGKYSSSISHNIIILSLVIILSFLIVTDSRLFKRKIKTDSQVEILREKVNNLSNINNNLKNKLNASLDKNYIEKVLREKGIYKKPDEEAVVIVPNSRDASSSASVLPKEKMNLWQEIWQYVKNLFR